MDRMTLHVDYQENHHSPFVDPYNYLHQLLDIMVAKGCGRGDDRPHKKW